MVTSQKKTLEALQIAIQMEIDGKEFYLKSSESSNNELGKSLLQSLARAEDLHRQKFIEIYEAIRSNKAWPQVDFQPDAGKSLKTVFASATAEIVARAKPLSSELDAIQTAMTMENKTFDFYNSQQAAAADATEKGFYKSLAAEEREHHLALLDYYEFLKNPAGWFVKKEHPSIDGG